MMEDWKILIGLLFVTIMIFFLFRKSKHSTIMLGAALLIVIVSVLTITGKDENRFRSAVMSGDFRKARTILDESPQIVNSPIGIYHWTPLIYASNAGSEDLVEELLKKGADPSFKGTKGRTALHFSVVPPDSKQEKFSGKGSLAELLLKGGADVNASDNDGFCPLHYAAAYGNVEVASVLIMHGADVIIRNNMGFSPLDIAIKAGHEKVASIIRNYDSKKDSLALNAERGLTPAPVAEQPRQPKYSLRSEPKTVSDAESKTVFGLGKSWCPLTYIQNQYEDRSEVVVDHSTGLMWQQAGSGNRMRFSETQAYIESLNVQKFAGYDDWRLPTIPEIMSLLEPERQSNGLYIDPGFKIPPKYPWYWSADRRIKKTGSPELGWSVYFDHGFVSRGFFGSHNLYVRAVRS